MTVAERVPETVDLERVLGGLVAGPGEELTIVERTANPYTSTHASEIVRCRVETDASTRAGGATELVSLLCKYQAAPPSRVGLVGGIGLAHEAFVTQRIAAPSGLSLPRLYGVHQDPSTGGTWLVVTFIDGVRLTDGPWPDSIVAAATWIGRFHAYWDERTGDPSLTALTRLDAARLQGQLDRAIEFLRTAPATLPAAGWLIDRWPAISEAMLGRLLSVRPTVVHGEFYPDNLVLAAGQVFPVDWESAAIAPGEIDLATLTERWDDTSVELMREAYLAARWPGGEGPSAGVLEAAQLFVQVHWLAERFDWADPEEWWRLDGACRAAIDLGID